MADYILVKKSQVHLFEAVPLYYKTKGEEFALYKKSGERLAKDRLKETKYPGLYISSEDREQATKELMAALNMDLAKAIAQSGLVKVKQALGVIVEEALTPGSETAIQALPETIEVLLGAYAKDSNPLEYLTKIAANSSLMVEHTVNVTALTLQYCFFHELTEEATKRLGLAALVHDAGCANIDRRVLETKNRLSEKQFMSYITHPVVGHDMIIVNTDFEVEIPTVALEHHERIDGSGYPHGLMQITADSQLIGLIDSYESLTYRDKTHRKATKPFDSLTLIKDEAMKGKFSKTIFREFASCLVR